MLNKYESEIKKNWITSNPIISICCLSYNHEKYIKQMFDSILEQETIYNFEILIHDDASTDNTQEIIKLYARKFPSIIKPILQKENQKSKGYRMNPTFNFPRAKGEYIAICEGDDYWTNPNKLQMQIDEMKKYNIGFSFHLNSLLYKNGECIKAKKFKNNKIYNIHEIIRADFHLVQTNTMLFKKNYLDNLNIDILKESPVGDIWTRIAVSIPDGALFINKDMATYRVMSEGSWSSSMQNNYKFKMYITKMINIINNFDEYWKYQYTNDFFYLKNKFILSFISKKDISNEMKSDFINFVYKDISLKNKLLYYILYKTNLLDYLRGMKKNIRRKFDPTITK